jgi:DNA polymerase III alpha subunit|tara:strand:- start:55790 stop:56314 length:525 start_codon:yes stop_codon:yes gene_type:complete
MERSMHTDEYGIVYHNELELFEALYKNPKLDIGKFNVTDPDTYNNSADKLYSEGPRLHSIDPPKISIEDFDKENQSIWNMPKEYAEFDICEWLLAQCDNDAELQRVGTELLMFQERNLLNLLRFLKYFVETMRKNNTVMGLGRGSSVSSFVLYKLGVHKVNSMYYDLDVGEFLR